LTQTDLSDCAIATPPSFWNEHEYKNMWAAEQIIEMKDGALSLADAKGNLPIPLAGRLLSPSWIAEAQFSREIVGFMIREEQL
jgi:hypothetical protein